MPDIPQLQLSLQYALHQYVRSFLKPTWSVSYKMEFLPASDTQILSKNMSTLTCIITRDKSILWHK